MMVHFKLEYFLLYRKDADLGVKVVHNFCTIKMRQMHHVSLLLFLIRNQYTCGFNLPLLLIKQKDLMILALGCISIRVNLLS